MEKKHAVIIGGSLGGLFTANLLRPESLIRKLRKYLESL